MKTKVTFLDRKVFVNKDKGTVAVKETGVVPLCLIEGFDVVMEIRAIRKMVMNYRNHIEGVSAKARVVDGDYLVVEASHCAKCNPEDTFNETVGRDLASTKAQEWVFRLVAEFFSQINDEVKRLFYHNFNVMWCNNMDASFDCYNHHYDYIEKLKGDAGDNEVANE